MSTWDEGEWHVAKVHGCNAERKVLRNSVERAQRIEVEWRREGEGGL